MGAAAAAPAADSQGDPIAVMVGRLDLEKYKSTIKGLTQFGDRRQGTDRMDGHGWGEAANEAYATDYPAAVGPHMTNTDSTPFMDLVPAISLRENQRGTEIGAGWDPTWHQPTDLYSTFSDQDFRLGLNAAQTTLGAVARLTGAVLVEK